MDKSVKNRNISVKVKEDDNFREKNMLIPSCSNIINANQSKTSSNVSKAGLSFSLFNQTQNNIPVLENLKVAIRNSGFSETGTTEILGALNVLAKYGILATNQGNENNNIDVATTFLKNSLLANGHDATNETSNGIEVKSTNVEVPENIVGAILGTNGRKLTEIHLRSGAKIQISPKGVFAAGTSNRIVTITGHPTAIVKAKLLIEQSIQEEKTERAQKSLK